jgi:hypothetical protein
LPMKKTPTTWSALSVVVLLVIGTTADDQV